MKNITVVALIMIVLFSQFSILVADGTQPTGSGTSGDPYIISSLNHLLWISTNSSSWDKTFLQTSDIDASGTASWNSDAGWSPIGTDWDNAFYGQYNGGGYSISGLTISRSSGYQGFIGVARDGVVLHNINLTSVSIEMTGNSRVGALAGEFQGSSISNCRASGTVKGIGSSRIGGLIGQNGSTVSNCSFSGTVTDESGGSSYMGGLIGYNGGSIEESYASVSITGNNYTGGLVGFNDAGTINRCYSTTSESNTVFGSYYVGGLTGNNASSSTITESYSTADVVAYVNYAGGITGINSNSTISDCYSMGSVTRSQDTNGDFGSFIGKNEYTTVIANCYSTGAVIYQGATNPTDKGFIGNYSTTGCSNNFFDTQTSSQSGGAGAAAKTTSEMKILTTFTDAGWDFEAESANGTDDYWDMDNTNTINNGYPYLSWEDGGDVSLPVELTNFSLIYHSNGVYLKWRTESEFENLGFIIERQEQNSNSWVEISSYLENKFLEGHGNTSSLNDYSYIDSKVQAGKIYLYRLGDVDYNGIINWHSGKEIQVPDKDVQLAVGFGLHKAYPNPFNPSTNISYNLPKSSDVVLSIFDVSGYLVETLVNRHQNAGDYQVQWNATGYSSGVYFYQIQTGDFQQVRKMLLIK